MDPQLLAHSDFLAGLAGGILGLLGGAIGFYFSWRSATSWKQKRDMIVITVTFLTLLFLLIGTRLYIQFQVSDAMFQAISDILYPFLLMALILFSIHWFRMRLPHL